MATGHRDIIPCNIISITQDKVQYRDMLGNERSIPRDQVAGFRLDTLQEKGFWQEPLIFDNSWVYSGNREDDYRTQSGRKLMNALKPKSRETSTSTGWATATTLPGFPCTRTSAWILPPSPSAPP